jgi:hypothetical protein
MEGKHVSVLYSRLDKVDNQLQLLNSFALPGVVCGGKDRTKE